MFVWQYWSYTKRALRCIFPGLGFAEILRSVNLDTLNVRRESICPKHFDKIKVGTHRLNDLLPDKKDIPNIKLDKKVCTRCQLLELIDSVTPLYRGLYTTVSKKVINMICGIKCISIVFVWCFWWINCNLL